MNYKGKTASKSSKHQYLYKHYGKPTHCSNENCEKKSNIFEWCKKTGHKYTHDPNDYLWLCRSCHRRYDLTPAKRKAAIKNLWWKRGIEHPAEEFIFKKGEFHPSPVNQKS